MKIPPNLPPQQVKGAKAYGSQVPKTEGAGKPKNDSVSVSPEAQFLSALNQVPDVREEKIVEIKKAIQDGTYLTDDKLDQALDNLFKDL